MLCRIFGCRARFEGGRLEIFVIGESDSRLQGFRKWVDDSLEWKQHRFF